MVIHMVRERMQCRNRDQKSVAALILGHDVWQLFKVERKPQGCLPKQCCQIPSKRPQANT